MSLRSLWICGLLGVACASGPGGGPVVNDPEPIDYRHPAEIHPVELVSGGERLYGIVYVAQGRGPHPTAILLHGLPGHERNLDLAQALRRADWNVVFFHYRGAWGSGGKFSFGNALEDVHAVLTEVQSVEFAAAHRVDRRRIALVGHSLGGFLALTVASERPSVRCIASLAGANPGRDARELTTEQRRELARRLELTTGPLTGASGLALAREIFAQRERYDTTRRARAIATRPVLLVTGLRDGVTPKARVHDPLVEALLAAGAPALSELVLDADHSFSDHRIALARALVGWLDGTCR